MSASSWPEEGLAARVLDEIGTVVGGSLRVDEITKMVFTVATTNQVPWQA